MICGNCKQRDVTVQHVRDHALAEVTVDIATLTGYKTEAFGPRPIADFVAEHSARFNAAFADRLNPVVTKVALNPVTEEGVYLRDGEFFRVVRTKDGERLYAKRALDEGGWDYEKGAIYTLHAEDRATLAEVAAHGQLTGTCMVCARRLTNPVSVEAGIGPVCGGRI